MPAYTSPDNIQYPVSTDQVAPLETVFANLAQSTQNAITNFGGSHAVNGYRWANAAQRAAQTGMSDGDTGFQADDAVLYRYNGTSWVPWESAWRSYTATLGAFSVGNGTNSTSWRYLGGRVRVRYAFIFGTSGNTYPTQPTFTVPVPMRNPYWPNEAITNGALLDAGTASTLAGLVIYAGTANGLVRLAYNSTSGSFSGAASITTSIPWTWAPGDGMAGEFEYDPA